MVGYLLSFIIEWFVEQLTTSLFGFLLSNMASDGLIIFDLEPVKLLIQGTYTVGALLWGIGSVFAVFDMAIQYGRGRGGPQDLAMNFVRSYLAVCLFTVLPVPAYKLLLSGGWKVGAAIAGGGGSPFAGLEKAWTGILNMNLGITLTFILGVIFLVVTALCYFDFLKRSFYMCCLIVTGCLYMASVPRGYTDGFVDWCKQVIGLCVASFLQMFVLGVALSVFVDGHPLIGLAGMLAALQVDRLMQRYGGASGQINMGGMAYHAMYGVSMLARAF